MNIIIKATNIEITEDLKEWVERKLRSLEQLHSALKRKDTLPSGKKEEGVELYVEIGKTIPDQRTGKIFRAEAQMRLSGKSIRVEETTGSLKKSINAIKNKLKREIKQCKQELRPWE